jgi:hypothetical protein
MGARADSKVDVNKVGFSGQLAPTGSFNRSFM